MTLPGTEDDVYVHDILVVKVRVHQADAAGHAGVLGAVMAL
jgi:hypothetical protein